MRANKLSKHLNPEIALKFLFEVQKGLLNTDEVTVSLSTQDSIELSIGKKNQGGIGKSHKKIISDSIESLSDFKTNLGIPVYMMKYEENRKNDILGVISAIVSNKDFEMFRISIAGLETENLSSEKLKAIQVLSKFCYYCLLPIKFDLSVSQQKNILKELVRLNETRNPYEKGHSFRVARLSMKVARKMGFEKDKIRKLYWAALSHDLGKIGVPFEILNKPGTFNKDEFKTITSHSAYGEMIISNFPFFYKSRNILRHHHEKWDGTGYPDNLSGEKIPIGSRIIAIADAFDAMTNSRVYRKAVTIQEAIEELTKCQGSYFDPKITHEFIRMLQSEPKKSLKNTQPIFSAI